MPGMHQPNRSAKTDRTDHVSPRHESIGQGHQALGWLDIGYLKTGEKVSFASRESRERFNLVGALYPRIVECLELISSDRGREISFTHKYPHNIGFNDCVERSPGDEINYAQLYPSGNWIPMVLNREAEPTDQLTMFLARKGHNTFILLYGAMGPPSEPSPLDKRVLHNAEKRGKAEAFWDTHALVAKWLYHNRLIYEDSVQKECPWKK